MGCQRTLRRPHHDARPRPRLCCVKPVLLDSRLIQPKNAQSRAEEFQKLLRACKSPHTRLYMLLGIATAGRPEAILNLKWSQVDLISGMIHLNPQGRIQTTKRRPIVRIDLPLLEALRQAKAIAL